VIRIENQPLVKVHLYGDLAELYGPEHQFAIRSPREAVLALDANYPGFARRFIEHERYIVIGDGDVRDGEMAALNVAEEVHFIPMVEGRAFLGAALFTWLGFGALASQILGTLLFLGIAIGLSFLLKPKQPEQKETEDKKDESFAFSGPENVTAQGVAVPLIYGRVWAGTVVISAGLDVTDVPIT
jgi:predicted phage tail protein